MELPEQPIFDQYPEWIIQPVQPVGWSATKYTGASSHTVAAPTIMELRQKLHEIGARAARP